MRECSNRGRPVTEKNATFEEHLSQLEEVVRQLEEGDLALEEALSLFEEGVRASRACAQVLDRARTRLRRLVAESDGTFRLDVLEE